MRIVGGKYRGRKLFTPQNDDIRPTADKVRESLFNILGQNISGTFFDVFGGSGAVGVEAFSRGAEVTINDVNKKSIELIKKNVALVSHGEIKVINYDYKTAIRMQRSPFKYIFLDPPYKYDIEPCIEEIIKCGLMDENSILIYEHNQEKSTEIEGLECYDTRKYGYCILSLFRLKEKKL